MAWQHLKPVTACLPGLLHTKQVLVIINVLYYAAGQLQPALIYILMKSHV